MASPFAVFFSMRLQKRVASPSLGLYHFVFLSLKTCCVYAGVVYCILHFSSVSTDRGLLNHTAFLFFLKPEGTMVEEAPHIETTTQQTLHYTLANQQVQFHHIGEVSSDGEFNSVFQCVGLIH